MRLSRYSRIAGLFSLYIFFCTLVVSGLFVIGNLQAFLENTNRLLLDILEWLLFILIITNIYYLFFHFTARKEILKQNKRKRGGMGPIWSFGGCIYGLIFLLLINAITAWF